MEPAKRYLASSMSVKDRLLAELGVIECLVDIDIYNVLLSRPIVQNRTGLSLIDSHQLGFQRSQNWLSCQVWRGMDHAWSQFLGARGASCFFVHSLKFLLVMED